MLYTGVQEMGAEDSLEKIISMLRKHPEGLTISSVAKLSGLHRHTSAKYVKELVKKGDILERKVGSAKLCYLRKESTQERKPLLSDKGEKGLKIIAILTIAFLLLFQASIVAQNLSNFFNISNISNLKDISGRFTMSSEEDNESSGSETDGNVTFSTITAPLPLNEEIVESTTTTSTTAVMSLADEENNTVDIDNSTSLEDLMTPSYSFFGASKEKAKVGEEVEFFAFWQDDFGLDEWIFSWNSSGSWENESHIFVSSYDNETKVLTRQGWKYFKDLNYEDEVATLSESNIKWERPLRIVELPYDDGIYKINGGIDIYVTPKHKVFARINYPLDFVKRARDLLFGVDLKEFKFIEVEKAYELAKAGYGITFLDENLKPIYVKQISLENYKGKIYDITVPNHIILVKKFGKAVWSSNLNVLEAWSNVTKTVNSAGSIAFKFYASDLAGNWIETKEGNLEVFEEENIIYLTVFTDKKNYTQSETINILGEFLVNGSRNGEINLSIEFNNSSIYSTILNAIDGVYSNYLVADFYEEGEYSVKVSSGNFGNSTSFYYTLNFSAPGNIQPKPEISIERTEAPSSVNVSEEFEVKAFITSLNGNSSDVFVSLQAPQEFAAEGLQKTIAQIGKNESSMISWLLKASECGKYTLNVTAETNESKDFKSFDVSVECLETTRPNVTLVIDAFVSVENVTKGNKTWKFVKVSGNVSLNESIISSNVSIVIKDPKGKTVFQDNILTDGKFLFNFELLPKISGTYTAEIFAETKFGNINKTLGFDILKHLKLKPKIKQEKFNYGLGEKIKFEILVLDEDTKELYSNATIKVFVVDPEGNVSEVNFTEDEIEKGKYWVELDTEREFRPGVHKLKLRLSYISPNPGEVIVEEETTFAVGLISINTKKSIYHPRETAEILMVVLNSEGHLVSGADVTLVVTAPDNKVSIFATNDGSISEISKGVYTASYETTVPGNYTLFATATTGCCENEVRAEIASYFLVKNFYEFDILRDTPITTDPNGGPFTSSIKIISYTKAENITFREFLPVDFTVTNTGGAKLEIENNSKVLTWENLSNNSIVFYSALPPFAWPRLYMLGPAEVEYKVGQHVKTFKEARSWMLVVDPLYICQWFTDSVSFSCTGTTGSSVNCPISWDPIDCPGTLNCYIQNITVFFYTSTTSTSNEWGYFNLTNTTAYAYYPASYLVVNAPLGPFWTCGANNNGTISSPNTCSLSISDIGGFTSNGPYYGSIQGPKRGSSVVSSIQYRWCWQDVNPKLENPKINNTQSGYTAGWGSVFNFSAELWDPYNETNVPENVSLWISAIAGEPFLFQQSRNYSVVVNSTPGQLVNFTQTFTCSGGSLGGGLGAIAAAKYYKLNVTTAPGNKDDTWNNYPNIYFIPLNDTILLKNATVNNSVVNRTDSIELSQIVYDSIRNTNVGEGEVSGTLYIQKSGSTFSSYPMGNTNSTGHLAYTLSSMCSAGYQVGPQLWYVYATGTSSCYYSNTSENMTVIIYGALDPELTQPLNGQDFNWGQTITIKGYVKNDCGSGESGAIVNFTLENGENIYYCSGTDVPGYPGNYSCGWDSSVGVAGYYNITMNASKGYFYNNSIKIINAFKLVTTPQLNNPTVTPSSGGWGKFYNYTIAVSDASGETVNVSFWLKKAGGNWEFQDWKTCTDCSNTVLWFTKSVNFTCNDIGTWFFKFNATDNLGTSNTTSGNDYHVIDPDKIILEYVSGNETTATPASPAEFVLRAYDIDKGNYDISQTLQTKFNVTMTSWEGANKTVGYNTTNATGYVYFYFLPDADFTSGKRQWWGYVDTAASICYGYNKSSNYNVTINVNWPPKYANETVMGVTEGASYGWGETWNFTVEVRDDEGDDLNISLLVDAGAGFVEIMKKNCTACSAWTQINFTDITNFTCSYIGPAHYKFRVVDSSGNVNETPSHPFAIQQDTILLEDIVGNNSIANRRGDQVDLLAVRVRDLNGTLVPNLMVNFSIELEPGVPGPVYGNLTNASGYSVFYFNPGCSPKYKVGDQRWKIEVAEGASECYGSASITGLNLTIMGDITLSFQKPDGSTNYTQEQKVPFLGATTDDCGDPLTTTVRYFANKSEQSYECSPVSQVGANAYTCDWQTDITTPMGWYNASMFVNRSYHYDNSTANLGTPGLFYLYPVKKLEEPTAIPTTEGWGYPNWNFSVKASSGDSENVLNISLYMHTAWPPIFKCDVPTCLNQTPTECANCINSIKYWYRNFSANQQGVWYYQFKMDGAETYQVLSVTVEKDDVNVSYGGEGNDTTVIKDTQPQWLSVRVYDFDRQTYNVTNPSATVTFKLYHSSYPNGYKIIGNNYTDDEGYARFLFNVTTCSGWYEGPQLWAAEINSSEPNYKPNASENFTIKIQLPGCAPQLDVYEILKPKEVFIYRNFTINATVATWVDTANDVNVTITVPSGWQVDEPTRNLGSISVGEYKKVWWQVNATSYGEANVTVFANSSNAGNDTLISNKFIVYKVKTADSPLESLPLELLPGENRTFSWNCEAGSYRIANLTI
ncbi:MAG: Hint domain-containing protein, partial [Candidatus Aenigmatarchaeota archaeon]